MRRELPSGLSARQRLALSEFFAGHLSAGQLSERLSLAGTARERVPTGSTHPGGGSGKPSPALRRRRRLAVRLVGLLAIALAGVVIGAALGSRLMPTRPSTAGASANRLASKHIAPIAHHHRHRSTRSRRR